MAGTSPAMTTGSIPVLKRALSIVRAHPETLRQSLRNRASPPDRSEIGADRPEIEARMDHVGSGLARPIQQQRRPVQKVQIGGIGPVTEGRTAQHFPEQG